MQDYYSLDSRITRVLIAAFQDHWDLFYEHAIYGERELEFDYIGVSRDLKDSDLTTYDSILICDSIMDIRKSWTVDDPAGVTRLGAGSHVNYVQEYDIIFWNPSIPDLYNLTDKERTKKEQNWFQSLKTDGFSGELVLLRTPCCYWRELAEIEKAEPKEYYDDKIILSGGLVAYDQMLTYINNHIAQKMNKK